MADTPMTADAFDGATFGVQQLPRWETLPEAEARVLRDHLWGLYDEPKRPRDGTYDERRSADTPCPDCHRIVQHQPCPDPETCPYKRGTAGVWITPQREGER